MDNGSRTGSLKMESNKKLVTEVNKSERLRSQETD